MYYGKMTCDVTFFFLKALQIIRTVGAGVIVQGCVQLDLVYG